MIDEESADRLGWARFSDDRTLRFRLGRIVGNVPDVVEARTAWNLSRVVFVMINPSTADAFIPDRTISKCCLFAQAWGAHVLEVVNLFALISTDPTELTKRHRLLRGDDIENDREILSACSGASRVIAAWGNWGELGGRANYVRQLLRERHIGLEVLRFTKHGFPSHPLARGKGFIPITQAPQVWA